MHLASVIGTIVSTSKDERLVGFKLLLTQPLNPDGTHASRPPAISVDTVGAGIGERVIVVGGSSARAAAGRPDAPIDSAVVGIIDTVEVEG